MTASHLTYGALACLAALCIFLFFLLLKSRREGKEALRSAVQRKREAELSEQRFRTLFTMAPYGCTVNDLQGRFLMVNQELCRRLGRKEEEFIGRTAFEVGLVSDAELFSEALVELLRSGEIGLREVLADSAHGISRVLYSSRLVELDGSRAILSTTIDITKREREQIRSLSGDDSFHRLFQAAPIPLAYAFDSDGYKGTVWNECWFRTFGYSPEQVKGHSGDDFGLWVDPDDRQCFVEGMRRENNSTLNEVKLRCADGRILICQVYGRFIGRPGQQMLVAAYLDISERFRAEQERENLQGQLAQAQRLESVGQLAGGVAHDYNNMLGVILGNLEMAMLKGGADNPLRPYLREIRKAAERSARLTEQLLAFARRQAIAPVRLDLNAAVDRTLEMLRLLIGENIELSWLPGGDVQPVRIDPSQLDQLLINLVVNGRDAIDGTGCLTIETSRINIDRAERSGGSFFVPGDYVLLSVSDNGCGMDKETQSRIFEPFFTTKKLGQGTGLGLATLYGIVKQNDGFVTAYSELGIGTTFKIYLPLLDDGGEISTEPEAAVPLHGQEKKAEMILIVEDEPELLAINADLLKSLGYRVLAANRPKEAIELVRENRGQIDLLLTDVVLPEMNGRELERAVRAENPGVASLFTSGYTANVISSHGVLDDGVCFLQKPFTLEQLSSKVQDALVRQERKNNRRDGVTE